MLRSKRMDAVSTPLDNSAVNLALEHINSFGESLLLQAKLLAYEQGDVLVLSRHIRDASEFIQREKQRSWRRELAIVCGGALFGAGAQGFLGELGMTQLRPTFIGLWVVVAFVGLVAVFAGLMTSKR